MKIEEGKWYKRRDGHVVGPAHREIDSPLWLVGSTQYREIGRFYADQEHALDLIEEMPPELAKHPDAIKLINAVAEQSQFEHVEVGHRDGSFYSTKQEAQAALRIYLSGPMKGYPQSNYPLFAAVAAQLRRAGNTVYNPAEFPHEGDHATFPLRKAFAAYAKFICEEADAIVLLPGWEASKGVKAELALAENCSLQVLHFEDLRISA